MTFEFIWVAFGIIGWLYFLLVVLPRDAIEIAIALILIVPCVALGPVSIITVAVLQKIDPSIKTRP